MLIGIKLKYLKFKFWRDIKLKNQSKKLPGSIAVARQYKLRCYQLKTAYNIAKGKR